MKAILLAGGYGTRLYPLTLRTPKALLPVAGKPVMQHTVELLVQAGMPEIYVSLKENQRKLQTYFGTGRKLKAKIKYIFEPDAPEESKLGSVGAIDYIFSKIRKVKEAMVIGGDNFILGIDLSEFARTHRERGAHASMALYELPTLEETKNLGVALLNESGRIIKFQEKPHPSAAVSKLASTAIYHLEEAFVRKHLRSYAKMKRKKGEKADKIGDLWEHFVSDLHLSGYPFKGLWGDIGNAEGYLSTNREAFDFLSREKGRQVHSISPHAKIAKSAKIIPPAIIEENCVIQENAQVGPYVHVLHSCDIGKAAHISNSIIFERCIIGERVRIGSSLVDGHSVISDDAQVTDNSILGFRCKIGASSALKSARVYPNISVEPGSEITGELSNDSTPSALELLDSCYWL